MLKLLKKILYEPLFHFLLIGSAIYIYYISQTVAQIKSPIEKIVVSKQEIPNSMQLSSGELTLEIRKSYYEKVLLNEAYGLGLDRSDSEIKERLIKQMHYILLNSVKYVEPTQEELYKYYKEHIEDYSETQKISFYNLFFAYDQEKAKRVYEMLELLDANTTLGEGVCGDEEKCFIKEISLVELKKLYGNYFTNQLFRIKKGAWHQPIRSKKGVHVVYINSKKIAEAYPFDEVEDRVYQDYLQERKKRILMQSYKDILSNYYLEVRE